MKIHLKEIDQNPESKALMYEKVHMYNYVFIEKEYFVNIL